MSSDPNQVAGLAEELDRCKEVLCDPRTISVGDGRYLRSGETYEFSPLIIDLVMVDSFSRVRADLGLGDQRTWWRRLVDGFLRSR